MFRHGLLIILISLLLSGCLENKFSGYVGSSTDSGGGTTAPSNLIVMIPTMNEVLFVEGASTNVIIQFSKPLPRDTVINWEIKDAAGEFTNLSGTLNALEESGQIQ